MDVYERIALLPLMPDAPGDLGLANSMYWEDYYRRREHAVYQRLELAIHAIEKANAVLQRHDLGAVLNALKVGRPLTECDPHA